MLARFKSYFLENKPVFIILLIGILIRLIYLWQYSSLPQWEQLTIDNNFHHNWALSILSGNILGDTTYFRAPFYIFYLAAIYKIFGISLWAVRLFGIIPGIIAVYFTYLLGKRVFHKEVGYIAAALHAIYPIMYYFESELLLDPLFMLLMEISIYYFIKWWDEKSWAAIGISGLFMSLAAITRPTSLIIVPIILIVLFFASRKKLHAIMYIMIFLFGTSVFILPVFVRNIKIARDPVLIASQGGINLYLGNNDAADGISSVMPEPYGFNWRIKQITFDAERDVKRKLKPGEVSTYWTKKAWAWIKGNPGQFLTLYLKKLYHNISNREISNNRYLDIFFKKVPIIRYNYLSFGIIFSLAVVALFLTVRENKKVLFIFFMVLLYILVTSLFFFSSRFRLPLIPYYIVLASYTLYILRIKLKTNIKSALFLIGVILVIGLFSFYPVVALPKGDASRYITSQGLYFASQGENAKALQYFKKAKEVDPNAPEINMNIGAMFLELGNPDSALYYSRLEKEAYPRRYQASINIASVLFTQKKYHKAMSELRDALKICPYDLNANLLEIRIENNLDTTSNGTWLRPVIETAIHRTDFNIYLLNEAAVYLSNRNLMKPAEDILLKAVSSSPPPIETDDASFSLNSPDTPQAWDHQKAQAHYQLGYIYGLEGKFESAIGQSKEAIALNPDLEEAYVNLVSGYLSMKRIDEAMKVLNKALEKFPSNKNLLTIKQYFQ